MRTGIKKIKKAMIKGEEEKRKKK